METFSALLAICAGNSPHKDQWHGALMFSLMCVWINSWVNNRKAGDVRRYSAHYDVSEILMGISVMTRNRMACVVLLVKNGGLRYKCILFGLVVHQSTETENHRYIYFILNHLSVIVSVCFKKRFLTQGIQNIRYIKNISFHITLFHLKTMKLPLTKNEEMKYTWNITGWYQQELVISRNRQSRMDADD